NQEVYTTPEDGMRAIVNNYYSNIDKIEIAHSDNEMLDNLWFVEARVWATSRSDGKGMTGEDCDNLGNFFLRVDGGWVHLPESKKPLLTAFGKWLFNLNK
ncbi:hypothetical protein KKD84_02905, partial [Patescibacteria group bacterium]|nr:hypothetical protein [Patescibacteria group bacterium]